MTQTNLFPLSTRAAEAYARDRIPALFAPLADATLDALCPLEDVDTLDLACGTGVLAFALDARVKGTKRLTGLDLNPAMIEIARASAPERSPAIEWIEAPADAMPIADESFDRVLCQMSFQFFPDRPAALAEIGRVLRPKGSFNVTFWAAIPPLFEVVAEVLGRRTDAQTVNAALKPFAFRDADIMVALLVEAGFEDMTRKSLTVNRVLPDTHDALRDQLLYSHYENQIRALPPELLDTIVREIRSGLDAFAADGRLELPQEAQLFSAVRRRG